MDRKFVGMPVDLSCVASASQKPNSTEMKNALFGFPPAIRIAEKAMNPRPAVISLENSTTLDRDSCVPASPQKTPVMIPATYLIFSGFFPAVRTAPGKTPVARSLMPKGVL